jgi:hypothetical protein
MGRVCGSLTFELGLQVEVGREKREETNQPKSGPEGRGSGRRGKGKSGVKMKQVRKGRCVGWRSEGTGRRK